MRINRLRQVSWLIVCCQYPCFVDSVPLKSNNLWRIRFIQYKDEAVLFLCGLTAVNNCSKLCCCGLVAWLTITNTC